MRFGKTVISLMTCLVFGLSSAVCFAQSEVEALLDVLVKKGVISSAESQQLVSEARQAAQVQQIKAIENGPGWLAKTTFKGDLRIRHQYEQRENSDPKHRWRTRFRYGLTNDINKKLTVGARVATGNNVDAEDGSTTSYVTDPRSTNQTWQEVFGKWEINLDEAYFDWHPYEMVSIIGGKREVAQIMSTVSDLIWGTDLTFDGGALMLKSSELFEGFKLFSNIGGYVLDQEVTLGDHANQNPWMATIQPGFIYTKDIGSPLTIRGAISYINTNNIETKLDAKGAQSTNDPLDSSRYQYHYDVFNPTMKVEYTWGGEKKDLYTVAAYSDWVYNPDPGDAGYLFGTTFGYKKTGQKLADWQVFYNYRFLEDDAFLDVFPDSDSYSGRTGIKGHELGLKFGLAKNVELGLDYYLTRPIEASGNFRNKEHLIQTDLLFKF